MTADCYGHFSRYWHAHPTQRRGQAAFNALWERWPDQVNVLVAKGVDPFYNDDLTEPFICGVQGLVSGADHGR